MKEILRKLIQILFAVTAVLIILRDLIRYGTVDMAMLGIAVTWLMISLLLWKMEYKKYILLGFVIFYLCYFATLAFTVHMFGSTQSIACLQGYWKIVHDEEAYYVIPVPEVKNNSHMATHFPHFITRKITSDKMLEAILKEYYLLTDVKISNITKVYETVNEKRYRVITKADTIAFISVYTQSAYSYFEARL